MWPLTDNNGPVKPIVLEWPDKSAARSCVAGILPARTLNLIHLTSWKAHSANFPLRGFSEVRIAPVLCRAAENARRRQLVEAREFRQRLSIVDAKKGNTTHTDLTPRQQVYQTED